MQRVATVSRRPSDLPVEPAPSAWELPSPEVADEGGVVAVGADLAPGTLLAAYRHGLFPMPIRARGREVLAWWSPDPRGVIPLDGLRVSRSLRRSARRFEVRVDSEFDLVVETCADPSRNGHWITPEIAAAYGALHRLGWAHSVECWDGDRLVGGLYGVGVGGLFAGESMFSAAPDASKVALVALVDLLRSGGATPLDVQWTTDHLASLGAVDLPRRRYLELLADAIEASDPFSPP